MVGQLDFFPQILSPGLIQDDFVGSQWSSHHVVKGIGRSEKFSGVIAFHSALTSLDILSIHLEGLIHFVNSNRVLFVLHEIVEPCDEEAGNNQFGSHAHVSIAFPGDISDGVLDEPESVLEESFFVSSVDSFFAESVLFEVPVILSSDGSMVMREIPVGHF